MSNEAQNGNVAKPMSGAVRVRMMDYMVHLKTDAHTLYFEAYPVQDWEHLPTGKKGFSYIDKENEPYDREIFEEGKCLKKFEGSFCWRGVWEGRLYFTDEEYFGEEISEMSELYNNHIVTWCKDFIKKREPSNYYDE
jgi:hypothetical protein